MDDLISRQAAIDLFLSEGMITAAIYVERMPSAQPAIDEWCTDCKEYDHEQHCCPRWNRVIRTTLNDMKGENNDASLDN